MIQFVKGGIPALSLGAALARERCMRFFRERHKLGNPYPPRVLYDLGELVRWEVKVKSKEQTHSR
jgi:hypothetical protein